MKDKTEQLLEELVKNIKSKQEFDQVRNQLLKRGVENLLNAEMTAHLGHEKGKKPSSTNIRNGFSEKTLKTAQGEQTIKVPRDRDASFEPVVVPKHQSMSEELENCILLLYAKGMSNADIVDFIKATYRVQYSTSQVSVVTNKLLEDIKQWQIRPLDAQYAVVWIDAIHYKIRHEGKVKTRACMLILGINMEGKQDLLSMTIVENESASRWMDILDDLRKRGVEDIIFLCSDNLSGLDQAIEAIYPKSIRQICIVHQIRNSLKFLYYKERPKVMEGIREIYQADNEQRAIEALDQFKEQWNDKYPRIVKSWENNWDNLTAFLHYPKEIRRLIYTTNVIESFNAKLRKYTKNKKVFPNDDAAIKSIYLAAEQSSHRWGCTRAGWAQVYNQLYVKFEERIRNYELSE